MANLNIYLSRGGLVNQDALDQLLKTNNKTKQYGLVLTGDEAREILEARNQSLRNHGRVELDMDMPTKMIYAFCNSSFMFSEDYASTINELVDIFYYIKNETKDRISDDDLINIMRDFFDKSCQGSTDLLKNRELALLVTILKQA